MASATQAAPAGKVRDDHLLSASRLEVAIAIRKAHHRVGVANVNPLRIWSWRVEGDAERHLKTGSKGFRLGCRTVFIHAAQDFDLAGITLRHEEVSIGSSADKAGPIRAGGIDFDFESRQGLRQSS